MIALATVTIPQASATCRFTLDFATSVYACNLENVVATSADDIIDLSGNHIGERTDEDVSQLIVFAQSTLEEIPSMIFDTFPNLELFNLYLAQTRHVDMGNCGTRLREIRINGNDIVRIQNGAFSGCTDIEYLQLIESNVFEIDEHVFDDIPNLIDLTILNNQLTDIQENLFLYSTRIENLRIDQNLVTTIHPRAFQSMISLRNINLQVNSLETILSGTFSNLLHLETLNLRANFIRSIEVGAFENLPYLHSIDMSTNFISVIDSYSFGYLPRFQSWRALNNGIDAIDRNMFDKLPDLRSLLVGFENNCVDRDFILIDSWEEEAFPYLEECFRNYEELNRTAA